MPYDLLWSSSLRGRSRARVLDILLPRKSRHLGPWLVASRAVIGLGTSAAYPTAMRMLQLRAAAASVSSACCKADAMTLLHAALIAHRRGMRAAEHGYRHSDNDALVAARAVLDVAAGGDNSVLFEHIDDYADDARLLSEFLGALVAAGEETLFRAATATRLAMGD
jgi:hypothetical protein